VVLGVVSSLIYVTSFALQQRANLVAMEDGAEGAGAVVGRREWVVGMVMQLVAFALQAAALGIGSMIVVEVTITVELVFMAPAGAWVLGTRPARREWYAALMVMAGLVAFVVAARPMGGLDSVPFADWVVPLVVVAVLFVGSFALGEVLRDYQALLRGVANGVWGGMMGALTKQTVSDGSGGMSALLSSWASWTLLVAGVLSILWLNLALRSGRLSSSLVVMSTVTPLSGLVMAIVVFDERLSGGSAALVVATLAVGVAAVGISLVARSPSLLALDEAAHAAQPESETDRERDHSRTMSQRSRQSSQR
jgi:hypothetical protein